MDRKTYLKKKNQERKATHKRFELSLPNAQAKPFERLAKKEGISPNKLIIAYAQAHLDERYIVPKALKKRLDQHNFLIRNLANNVNQIAHSSNVFHTAEKQAILKNLDELNTLVQNLVTELSQP
jgi:hypothetical protein